MKSLIVLFNLKAGISEAEYLTFAKELDIPTVKSLKSVSEFRVLKANGIFGTDLPSPYQYIEIIDFESVENLTEDMGNEPQMANIPAQFQALTDNPVFILSEGI